eukprot:scaffold16167_cov58-Phaeocystis_antarctica.AAC.4
MRSRGSLSPCAARRGTSGPSSARRGPRRCRRRACPARSSGHGWRSTCPRPSTPGRWRSAWRRSPAYHQFRAGVAEQVKQGSTLYVYILISLYGCQSIGTKPGIG